MNHDGLGSAGSHQTDHSPETAASFINPALCSTARSSPDSNSNPLRILPQNPAPKPQAPPPLPPDPAMSEPATDQPAADAGGGRHGLGRELLHRPSDGVSNLRFSKHSAHLLLVSSWDKVSSRASYLLEETKP